MDSRDLDRKINNFLHRKELEFPGLSLLGRHNYTVRRHEEHNDGNQRPSLG